MRTAQAGEVLVMEEDEGKKPDPLGFSLKRMLAGEASVEAGRHRPLQDAVDELRARDET